MLTMIIIAIYTILNHTIKISHFNEDRTKKNYQVQNLKHCPATNSSKSSKFSIIYRRIK